MNKVNAIDHLSVSSIGKAMNCPRSWWASYILKKDRPSGGAAQFGSQYDQIIGKRLNTKCHKEEPVTGGLADGVEEAVNGYLSQPHAFRSATDSQLPIHISPSEWEVMAEMLGMYSEIPYPITGYIDLYDSNKRALVDLKTSSSKRTTFMWGMQVLIYSLATQANEARIHLMTKTKTPAYYDLPVPVTPTSQQWAMQIFAHQAALIKQWLVEGAGEHLPRVPDYWCHWCAEELECPACNIILGG